MDVDLEEVNITLDGMEIVPSTSSYDHKANVDDSEKLPAHIQEMVNKAMNEMK